MSAPEPVALPPQTITFEGLTETETWTVTRESLDAAWVPLFDEKGRAVHGWALIKETPAHMLGRELRGEFTVWRMPTEAFSVTIFATRNGKRFGASPSGTLHPTRERALDYARKALAAQGKRYAKKYGGAL